MLITYRYFISTAGLAATRTLEYSTLLYRTLAAKSHSPHDVTIFDFPQIANMPAACMLCLKISVCDNRVNAKREPW